MNLAWVRLSHVWKQWLEFIKVAINFWDDIKHKTFLCQVTTLSLLTFWRRNYFF